MAEIMPKLTEMATIKSPRDPLRIAYSAINLYQALLPGITTQTQRGRYYSFVPWMKQEAKDKKRKKRNLEKLFIIGCAGDHDGDISGFHIIGVEAGKNEWFSESKKTVSLSFKLVKQNSDILYTPQFAFEKLCIVENFQPLSFTALGKNIVQSFEESTGSKLRKVLSKGSEFTKKQLKYMGEVSCICRLGDFPDETEALRKTLFGFINLRTKDFDEVSYNGFTNGEKVPIVPSEYFGSLELPHILRRASLFLIMEIVRVSERDNRDILQKIRDYVYFGDIEYEGEYVETVNENFSDIVGFWKVFILSNYYVYARESILTGLLHILRERPRSGWAVKDIMNLVLNESILKEIEELLEEKIDVKDLEKISVKDILDLILDSFGIDSSDMREASKKFDKECVNESWKNERDLHEDSVHYVRDNSSVDLFQKILANSALMLLFLYLRFYHRISDDDRDAYFQLAEDKGSDYYRADVFIKDLDISLSLRDFFGQLVIKTLELHDTAAIRKLYLQGDHSWWYLKEDNRLFFEKSYPTNPRIMPKFHDDICKNVLQILIDLGLITIDSESMYVLTREGKRWVGRYG